MAQAARARVGPLAVRDDVRHGRVIAGNQSAGPKPSEICWRVKLSVLPGSCFIDVSGAGGVAGAPAGGGLGMA